jgi:hypothetical protein
MATIGKAGQWVQIHQVVLSPGERAPQVPADTALVPLELRVRGFLEQPAALGEAATVRTLSGRRVTGQLVDLEPAYTHGFGRPVPALLAIGDELAALLGNGGPPGLPEAGTGDPGAGGARS